RSPCAVGCAAGPYRWGSRSETDRRLLPVSGGSLRAACGLPGRVAGPDSLVAIPSVRPVARRVPGPVAAGVGLRGAGVLAAHEGIPPGDGHAEAGAVEDSRYPQP